MIKSESTFVHCTDVFRPSHSGTPPWTMELFCCVQQGNGASSWRSWPFWEFIEDVGCRGDVLRRLAVYSLKSKKERFHPCPGLCRLPDSIRRFYRAGEERLGSLPTGNRLGFPPVRLSVHSARLSSSSVRTCAVVRRPAREKPMFLCASCVVVD